MRPGRLLRRFPGMLTALLLAAALSVRASDVPYLTGRVVDNAEILSPEARGRVETQLRAHEEGTSDQVVVLTVRSLGGESIEPYANQVFNEWGLGQKGKDNGVLLLVAPRERRLRIEVGRGLEGSLTDLAAGRIIRNLITPRFKEGKFDEGIEAGVSGILAVLGGAEAPADQEGSGEGGKEGGGFTIEGADMPWYMRILLGAFIFGIIGLFTVLGVLTPGAGWFLYFFLIPFWAMFPIVVIGPKATLGVLVTYLAGFPLAKLYLSRRPWYLKAKEELATRGTATVGGFTITSGGGSSGGSWSSGGRGGGFSGGGGSSGGGGASGSW